MIGVPYNYRYLPKKTMIKFFDKNGNFSKKIHKIPNEMFKVWGLGTGCMLIKTDVFRKIKPPYFKMIYDEKGKVIISGDIGFCEKARANGYDIWCEPTLLINHIGDYEY